MRVRAGRKRWWRSAWAAVGIATLIVGGCGDAGGSDKSSEIRYSDASEPAKVFAERLAKLLETTRKGDCAQLDQIVERSLTRFPCPPPERVRREMASFAVVGAEEYGGGAVVDYRSREFEGTEALVLFVAPNRTWGLGRFGVATHRSTGTSDAEARKGFADVVDDYLLAVRERDCDGFYRTAVTAGGKRSACKYALPKQRPLGGRLRRDPTATPRYRGGNDTYGFFTLETSEPVAVSSTISVIRVGDGADARYLVLDVAPSPTAAQQREVRESLDRRDGQGSAPG